VPSIAVYRAALDTAERTAGVAVHNELKLPLPSEPKEFFEKLV
jgi:hypothetical protein